MSNYKWIVFDFDGTLVDSINTMYKAYVEFMSFFKLKYSKEEFDRLNGPKLSEIVKILKEKHHISEKTEILEEIYKEKINHSHIENVKMFPGRVGLLNNLKQRKYSLALVTSTLSSIVHSYLKKFDLTQFFDIVVTGEDIKLSKPSPEIYLKFLSIAKCDPNLIIVFEDSLQGVQSANSAGLKCINIKNMPSKEFLCYVD